MSDRDHEVATTDRAAGQTAPHVPRDGLYRRLRRELSDVELPTGPATAGTVSEADLEGLPEVARRYLEFMGVIGRPRHWSFRARFEGRFQLRGRWMPAVAWQYNSGLEIARVFVMRLRFARIIPMIGVDTYSAGRGEMRGKLLGIVPVAHGEGDEFDQGELVTWLNDAVLLAPSFLLTGAVTWGEVDADSFDLTLTDADRTVSATVFVDERGAPRDFSTTDRYADLPGGLTRARWTTPIAGWTTVGGHPVPTAAQAIWHLPEGPMPYVQGRFVPGSLAHDVSPGA